MKSGASREGNIDQYLQQEGTCGKPGGEKIHCGNGGEGVRPSFKGCLSCRSALRGGGQTPQTMYFKL